ncbi:MAG: lycopene cyclase domain-containing protein [Treponemataceae bacterium]|nr:lycopene cyclase domain-containing protein [Treponemataceae bacterium]
MDSVVWNGTLHTIKREGNDMFYAVLTIVVLAIPLALSFDKRVAFYKSWPAVFRAILVVLIIFGGWDVWKTSLGVWSFNDSYVGPWRFLGLPLGEWLFFIAVPYACIFILACVRSYVPDRRIPFPDWLWMILLVLCIAGGILFFHLIYTGVVLISVALALLILRILTPHNLGSRNFWLALGLTYIPFCIVNGVLTGLPVVLYNNRHNTTIRLGPIPLEDFLFSLSLLLVSFSLFDWWNTKSQGKPTKVN